MEILDDKSIWSSWTFWGAGLLALEAGLTAFNASFPIGVIDKLIPVFGAFLTVMGIRRRL